jgi:16S rRNA (adenine1518-N6/adenine1519-N6)-dimethyltransferase
VATQVFSRPEYLFTVSPAAFKPPPKVESAVIRLERRDPAGDWGLEDPAAFLSFAGLCFAHKRKTLRNNLREQYRRIDGLPQASLRAEQVPMAELVALYRNLTAVQQPG